MIQREIVLARGHAGTEKIFSVQTTNNGINFLDDALQFVAIQQFECCAQFGFSHVGIDRFGKSNKRDAASGRHRRRHFENPGTASVNAPMMISCVDFPVRLQCTFNASACPSVSRTFACFPFGAADTLISGSFIKNAPNGVAFHTLF